jgi:beta-lactamase class D
MLSRSILVVSLIFLFASCASNRIKDDKDWSKYYEKYGIKDACIMFRDHNHEIIHYYNKERCIKRVMPASTFKIFNSLVALETAVAPDEKLVIKWDGVKRRDEWDKDMTMAEAFKVSCLPYYQEIARRVGAQKMQHYLDTANYGSRKLSGALDQFWLNDSLQISADEQLGFVKKLYFFELPFQERTQRIVKAMMLMEETPEYKLYYKTGTGKDGNKDLYWIVGFVERVQKGKEPEGSMNKVDFREYPYFFAQNFAIDPSDKSKNWFDVRKAVLHDILEDAGALGKNGEKK